jgi:hypothetical protein
MTVNERENSPKNEGDRDRVTGDDDAQVIYTRVSIKKRPVHKADYLMKLLSDKFNSITQNIDLQRTCESILRPFILKFFIYRKDLFPKQFDRLEKSSIQLLLNLTYFPDNGDYQTYIKYWHDQYLCKVCQDRQLPPIDNKFKKELYTGILRRIVRHALLRKDTSFIYSLQKGSKRVWPALPESKMMASLEKHRKCLSGGFDDFDPLIPKDLEDGISREGYLTFRPLFETGICESQEVTYTKFSPSLSACLQNKRSNLGSSGLFKPFDLEEKIQKKEQGFLGFRKTHQDFEDWKRSTLENALDQIIDQNGIVSVVPIPEPSKYRIITKGDGYEYTALQPIQGALIDCWKRSKYSTMNEPCLEQKVRSLDRVGKDLPIFCSVDYESATDFLKREATCVIAKLLKETKPFGEVAFRSLCRDIKVLYPNYNKSGKPGLYNLDPVDMVNGQLMGHPLSFPLLCTINVACYHVAISRWVTAGEDKKERKRRKRIGKVMYDNVIVNGDDMLFKCERSFYDIFLQTTREVGLRISQGKNYCSEFFCMINSQIFQRVKGRMCRQGYFNQKVLVNYDQKKGTDGNCTIYDAIDTFNEMVRLAPWTYYCKNWLIDQFKFWKPDQPQPNYYLPRHMGGLGMCSEEVPKLSRKDRSIAWFYYNNPEVSLFESSPSFYSIPKRYRNLIGRAEYILPDSVPSKTMDRESTDVLSKLMTMFKSSLSLDEWNVKNCKCITDFCVNCGNSEDNCRCRRSCCEYCHERFELIQTYINRSEAKKKHVQLNWGQLRNRLTREEAICFSYFVPQFRLIPSLGEPQLLSLSKPSNDSVFKNFPSITCFW